MEDFTIPCHYCEKEIETSSSEGLPGLFSLLEGRYMIVNSDHDKEAVCNDCLQDN
jgi:hypothetical protein